jgi:modified peptide precursor CbpA
VGRLSVGDDPRARRPTETGKYAESDGKGFRRTTCLSKPFFFGLKGKLPMKKTQKAPCQAQPEVLAYRKSCAAEGTGLSHYILMNGKEKKQGNSR